MSVDIGSPREAIKFYSKMTDDELVKEWDEFPYHEHVYIHYGLRFYALITVLNERGLRDRIIAECRKHKAYEEFKFASFDYFEPCAGFMRDIIRDIVFDDVWESPFNAPITNVDAHEHGSHLLNFMATGDMRQLLIFHTRIKSMMKNRYSIDTVIKVVTFWRTEIRSCRNVPFFVNNKESTFQKVFIDDWNRQFPQYALYQTTVDFETMTWINRPLKLWTSWRTPFFVLNHLFSRVWIRLSAMKTDDLVKIWDKGTLPKIMFQDELVEVPKAYMFICMSFALLNPDEEGEKEHICKRLNALNYPGIIEYIGDMRFTELPKVKIYQDCVPLWRGLMSEKCMSKELREKYASSFTMSFELCMISLQIKFSEFALYKAVDFMLENNFNAESLYEWEDEIEKLSFKTVQGVLVKSKYTDTYFFLTKRSSDRNDQVYSENPTFGEIVGLVDPKFWSRMMVTEYPNAKNISDDYLDYAESIRPIAKYLNNEPKPRRWFKFRRQPEPFYYVPPSQRQYMQTVDLDKALANANLRPR